MNFFKINPDPQVQKLLLDLLTTAVEAGEHHSLIEAGLPASLLDELRELRSYEVARLIHRDLNFGLLVDSTAMAHQIHILKAQLDDQRIREQFVAAGCPTPLALRLFRMNKRDVLAMRLSLNVGRPIGTVRSATQRHQVEDRWLELRPQGFDWCKPLSPETLQAEVKSWQTLMREFSGFSLHSLYQVVMRFERFGATEERA